MRKLYKATHIALTGVLGMLLPACKTQKKVSSTPEESQVEVVAGTDTLPTRVIDAPMCIYGPPSMFREIEERKKAEKERLENGKTGSEKNGKSKTGESEDTGTQLERM